MHRAAGKMEGLCGGGICFTSWFTSLVLRLAIVAFRVLNEVIWAFATTITYCCVTHANVKLSVLDCITKKSTQAATEPAFSAKARLPLP